MIFIPKASTPAGLSLTMNNWTEVGIQTLSFSLENFLVKPGIELLKKIENIKHYLGWQGQLILNAGQISLIKEGDYTVVSPHDGSKIRGGCLELVEIILHLKPDIAILPKHILRYIPKLFNDWNESIYPFLHPDDYYESAHPHSGIYFNTNDFKDDSLCQKYLKDAEHSYYLDDQINLDLIKELKAKNVQYIESDNPAIEALHGKVYTHQGKLDLLDLKNAQIFETIDSHCLCPTCTQGFSKAYLHHLFLHTPLLCQRYLIWHNIFYINRACL